MRSRILLIVLLLAAVIPIHLAAQDQRCFPETGKCIAGVIRAYWEGNGGLPVFGYPITDLATETNAEGFTGPTQWFERDRLEDQGPLGVLAGRLGAQKLAMEGRPYQSLPVPSGPAVGCLYFQETLHLLCAPFRAYWEQNGGLARFGYPVSEPIAERNAAGFTGTFQWFERRRMEIHPENQPPYALLLGLLGNEVRHGATPPGPPPPLPPPLPPAPTATSQPAPAPTATRVPPPPPPPTATRPVQNCDPSYPDFCIPPPPPDLNCPDIGRTNFTVLPPDPHRLDTDRDGIGCET